MKEGLHRYWEEFTQKHGMYKTNFARPLMPQLIYKHAVHVINA